MRIGPLTAIFIMNMIMIYKLNNLKLRKRYTRNRGLFSISRIVSDTETSTTTGIKSSNHIKKLTKEIKIGKVLVLISTTYLFFTLPHTIDLTIYMSLVSLDAGEGRGKRTNIMKDCFLAKMLTFFFSYFETVSNFLCQPREHFTSLLSSCCRDSVLWQGLQHLLQPAVDLQLLPQLLFLLHDQPGYQKNINRLHQETLQISKCWMS